MNFKQRAICALSAITITIFVRVGPVLAESEAHLLGDWIPLRQGLEEEGVILESIFSLDVIAHVSGGVEEKTLFLGANELTVEVDTERAFGWKGGTLFGYLLSTFGESPSEFVGDLQASDNIEADEGIRVLEMWYNQSLFSGRGEILAGLHDYNSEFYVLDSAGGLLNSSFGIGPEVAQAGASLYPATALAVRLKCQPFEGFYLLAAIYDGVPGNPDNPRGTHIHLGDKDGIFSAVEVGSIYGERSDYAKLALGGWYTTAEYEDFSGEIRDANGGLYAVGETRVFTEDENGDQGLTAFLQTGFAREDRNVINFYAGVGFSYLGLVPGRDEDTVSFGVAVAHLSDDFRESGEVVLERAETAVELNYRIVLLPYFSLTPDVQYIVNPGASEELKDAVVLGLRTEVAL